MTLLELESADADAANTTAAAAAAAAPGGGPTATAELRGGSEAAATTAAAAESCSRSERSRDVSRCIERLAGALSPPVLRRALPEGLRRQVAAAAPHLGIILGAPAVAAPVANAGS